LFDVNKALFVIIQFITVTCWDCYVSSSWIQHKFEMGPTKISMGLWLQSKGQFGPP